jgi:hypothetical protein
MTPIVTVSGPSPPITRININNFSTATTQMPNLKRVINNYTVQNNSKNDNLTLEHKAQFINKILNRQDEANSSELVFNSIQLINFIDFYFNNIYKADKNTTMHASNDLINEQKNQSSSSITSSLAICFPCSACSIKFTYEQTFQQHLNRRSLFIRVYCKKCGVFKTFYNKCKLFYHIYSHKLDLFEPIYTCLQIDNLPIEKSSVNMKNSDLNLMFTNLEKLFVRTDLESVLEQTQVPLELTNPLLCNRFKVNNVDILEMRTFLRCLLHNKFLVYKCHICDALFFSADELKKHYNQTFRYELNILKTEAIHKKISILILLRAYFKLLRQKMETMLNSSHSALQLDFKQAFHNRFFHLLFNHFSYKKLRFTTRCFQLAAMNFIQNLSSININKDDVLTMPQTQTIIITSPNHCSPALLSSPLICPRCGLAFDSRTQTNNFKLHIIYDCQLLVHYDFDLFKCPMKNCNFFTESNLDFTSHWFNKHVVKQHLCEFCNNNGVFHLFHEINPNTQSVPNNDPIFTAKINNDSNNYSNNKTVLSTNLLSEINTHYFEKHRNQNVSLKLVYKCLCRDLINPNLNDFHRDSFLVDDSSTLSSTSNTNGDCISDAISNCLADQHSDCCFYSDIKSCKQHISSFVAHKYANSIKCLFCKKSILIETYHKHMIEAHNDEKDSFFVCPICGLVKK